MKRRFRSGDIVTLVYKGTKTTAEISSISGSQAVMRCYGSALTGSTITVSKDTLTYVAPVKLTKEALRRFTRYECSLAELKGGNEYALIDGDSASYSMTLSDLLAALRGRRENHVSDDDFANDYMYPMDEDLGFYNGLWQLDKNRDYSKTGFADENEMLDEMWEYLYDYFIDKDSSHNPDTAEEVISNYLDQKNVPLKQRHFTDYEKRMFLQYWVNGNHGDEGFFQDDVHILTRQFIDEMCDNNNASALRYRGYACLDDEGPYYHHDVLLAEQSLLQLMKCEPDAGYADTLGMIYYNGEVNDGKPQYDKAFYYFSIGAAGGYYPSRCRMAEMFEKGLGVPKDGRIAANLISEFYVSALPTLYAGNAGRPFAEAAYRMGLLHENGTGYDVDEAMALYFYLQAWLIIRNENEDDPIRVNVLNAIDRVTLTDLNYARFKDPGYPLHMALGNGNLLKLTITRHSKDHAVLTISAVDNKLIVLLPECLYADQISRLTMQAEGVRVLKTEEDLDTILFDSIEDGQFLLNGRCTARIEADCFTIRLSAHQKNVKLHRFVSVCSGSDAQTIICRSEREIHAGDHVRIGDDDRMTGSVVSVFYRPLCDMDEENLPGCQKVHSLKKVQ